MYHFEAGTVMVPPDINGMGIVFTNTFTTCTETTVAIIKNCFPGKLLLKL